MLVPIYHKNCNLLKAISTILSQHKKTCNKDKAVLPESLDGDTESGPQSITAQTIADVARHLNSKLHEQAK